MPEEIIKKICPRTKRVSMNLFLMIKNVKWNFVLNIWLKICDQVNADEWHNRVGGPTAKEGWSESCTLFVMLKRDAFAL